MSRRRSLAALLGRDTDALERQLRELRHETHQLVNRLDRQAQPRTPVDEAFLETARAARASRRTLLGSDRLSILGQAVRNSAPLGLPALEVGSYRGGSAWFMAAVHRSLTGRELALHVVDTFSGHVAAEIGAADAGAHTPGLFGDTDADDVRRYLSEFPAVRVHAGAFAAVRDELPDGPYGLAHVDVDLFEPTQQILEFLAARLAPGGVVVVDDYGAAKCPGVAAAVAGLIERKGDDFQIWHPQTQQLVLVRRPGSGS